MFLYNGWRSLSSTVCIRLLGTSAVLTLSRGPEISPNSWREPLFPFPTACQKWLHTSYEPLPGSARAAPSACVCKWGAIWTLWGEYPRLPALLLRKKIRGTYLICVGIRLGSSECKQSWQVGLIALITLSSEDSAAVWEERFVLGWKCICIWPCHFPTVLQRSTSGSSLVKWEWLHASRYHVHEE